MRIVPPHDHLQSIKNLVTYYQSYYRWTGPENIRKWELRRARVSIMLACTIYRVLYRQKRLIP